MRVLPSVLASVSLAAGSASATAPTAAVTAALDRTATAQKCLKQLVTAFGANGGTAASLTDAQILTHFKALGPTSKYTEGWAGSTLKADGTTTAANDGEKWQDAAGTAFTYGTTNPNILNCGMDHQASSTFLTAANLKVLFGSDYGSGTGGDTGGAVSAADGVMAIRHSLNPTDAATIAGTGADTANMVGSKHCVVAKPLATTGGFQTELFTAPTAATVKWGSTQDIDGSGGGAANSIFHYKSTNSAANACTAVLAAKAAGAVLNACTTLYAQEAGVAGAEAGWKEVLQATGYVDTLRLGYEYMKFVVGDQMGSNTPLTTPTASTAGTSLCKTVGTTGATTDGFLGLSPCEANLLTILRANGAKKQDLSAAMAADFVLTSAANSAAKGKARWQFLNAATNTATQEEFELSFRSVVAEKPNQSTGDVVDAVYHADAYLGFGSTLGTVENPRITTLVDSDSANLVCSWTIIAGTGATAAPADAATVKKACKVTTGTGTSSVNAFGVGTIVMGDSDNVGGYVGADDAARLVAIKASVAAGKQFTVAQRLFDGTLTYPYLHWNPKDATTCTAAVRTALKYIKDERCFMGTNMVNWKGGAVGAGSHLHAFNAAFISTPKQLADNTKAINTEILGILPNMLKGCGWAAPTCAEGSGGTTVAACATCAKGKYNGVTTMTDCIDCAKGKYAAETGAQLCKSCPKGKWAASAAESCTNCVAGKYGDTLGLSAAAACKACTSGNTTAGASASTNCTGNTGVDNTGSTTKASGALSRFSALAITSLLALIAV